MDVASTRQAPIAGSSAVVRDRDGTHFVMAGSEDAVRTAVQRMVTSGWEFLSDPVESTDDIWSMWVIAPA